jgi:hypothetical protein
VHLRVHGARKVEANALVVAPIEGRQLLRDTIAKYLPPDAREQYAERLKAPRDALRLELQRQLRELDTADDESDEDDADDA